LASFPLSRVRAVTVFAAGFWHGHNSLTSLILNTQAWFTRRQNAVARQWNLGTAALDRVPFKWNHLIDKDAAQNRRGSKSMSWSMSESKMASNFF
jgi:ubiquinone biosynthesis protein Coq4